MTIRFMPQEYERDSYRLGSKVKITISQYVFGLSKLYLTNVIPNNLFEVPQKSRFFYDHNLFA